MDMVLTSLQTKLNQNEPTKQPNQPMHTDHKCPIRATAAMIAIDYIIYIYIYIIYLYHYISSFTGLNQQSSSYPEATPSKRLNHHFQDGLDKFLFYFLYFLADF